MGCQSLGSRCDPTYLMIPLPWPGIEERKKMFKKKSGRTYD